MSVDTILVPTDGSEQAEKAVEVAVNMAREFDSEVVHALFVVDSSIYAEPALSFTEILTDEVQERADELLADLRAEAEADGVRFVTDVIHGSPKETIVRQAESIGADLVVIGERGDEYRSRRGPVCQYVAKHAPCNVLVV
jgi:nucleotide-binding universal stress UspA family protein